MGNFRKEKQQQQQRNAGPRKNLSRRRLIHLWLVSVWPAHRDGARVTTDAAQFTEQTHREKLSPVVVKARARLGRHFLFFLGKILSRFFGVKMVVF